MKYLHWLLPLIDTYLLQNSEIKIVMALQQSWLVWYPPIEIIVTRIWCFFHLISQWNERRKFSSCDIIWQSCASNKPSPDNYQKLME